MYEVEWIKFVLLPGGRLVKILSHVLCVVDLMSARTARNGRLVIFLRRGIHLCNSIPTTWRQFRTCKKTNKLTRILKKFRRDLVTHVEQLDEDTVAFFYEADGRKSPRVQYDKPTYRTSHRASLIAVDFPTLLRLLCVALRCITMHQDFFLFSPMFYFESWETGLPGYA